MSENKKKSPEELRSYRWLGKNDLRSFGHRSRLQQLGYDRADWVGKPVIGIINTWSDINACHGHLRARAEDVKRGVYQAGGFPIELPAMSLAEPIVKPSTMMYRNFLAMECEEFLRSHPIDGAVLMGGCDKTTPGLIMGAISMGLPAIYVPAGPMLRGNWRGHALGSGSDAWKFWDEKRAGRIGDEEWNEIEGGIARSFGTCMVMGTAATMMAITEALGLSLPGASSIPAPDASHPRMCAASGRRAVEMVWEDLTPEKILTPAAFDNAIRVHMALGGSTNAIIHVIAMARRAGIPLDMQRFDDISRQVPVIANITPSGKFLMEDFFFAGGLRALMAQMKDMLDLSCITVTGRTLGEAIADGKVHLPDVIHSLDQPLYPEGATAVLKGNLAPRGCVMKPAAAEKRFLAHRGKAIAFEKYDHMAREVERDDLDVTPDHILVLKNGGPKGGPGMPEWGQLPIPKKLLKAGVRDMLRISDARMSGTSYGACILHVAPESFIGGPLALVQTGDEIEIDVAARKIHLHVSDEELTRRRAAWRPPPPHFLRGYGAMYSEHIGQADEGCDFDFLTGTQRTAELRFIDDLRGAKRHAPHPTGRTLVTHIRWLAAALALLFAAIMPASAQSPTFRVDPYWPKPLPNNWILGQVGGMAIDAQDNIWVFQRPRSLTDDEKGATFDPPRSKCCVPAPSVLVFNQAGDVVKSWGGLGDNLGYDWPLQEHAILVDNKGFVWLSGNGKGDSMVLKFTTDGKFVKQLGKRGPLTSSMDLSQFGLVAALELDAKANEIYAADGYGNHRVAVLDADTGEIKRIWGAYGKPPTDDDLPAYNPDSPQFATVHCIALAKDGLVFVCDRTNNRVQVFQKDGSFVRQYVFDPATKGSGSSWGLAFSPLDKKQNFFVLLDGTNNVLETVRRSDGAVVRTFGRPGRETGEFHWVHVGKFDSRGNFYTGEVDTGKRLQKWVPVE